MIEISWMRVGAGLALALVSACNNDGGHARGDGVLGFANFRWQCAGAGDIACIPEHVAEFPRGVALGSTFELSFVLDDEVPVEAGWIEQIGSAHTDLLSSRGDHVDDYDYGSTRQPSASFSAREAGAITLLALAQDDTVADFVTLSLIPVSRLAIVRECRQSACDDGAEVGPIEVGTTTSIRVEPYGDGLRLVGHLDYEWESLTPELVEIVDTDGHVATLEPRRRGTAELRVRGGGHEDTFAIEVLSNVSSEGPHRGRPSGTSGETEGSTSASSESGETETTTTASGGETDTDAGTTSGTSTTGGT